MSVVLPESMWAEILKEAVAPYAADCDFSPATKFKLMNREKQYGEQLNHHHQLPKLFNQ